MITEGMSITVKETVTEENTALALGSGSLKVYGSPAMFLFVERAAVTLLEGNLDGNMTSVGTGLYMDHIAPSPVGSQISCQVTLSKIDRKKLTFDVEISDELEVVGKGSHCRFIVDGERFQTKADNTII